MERRAPRISIHAPRVGGDMEKLKSKISNTISIHAPRVGGDSVRHFTLPGFHYFNPRPPCGGRLEAFTFRHGQLAFQSTPPVWGATRWQGRLMESCSFQSTPPVWGATAQLQWGGLEIAISIHAPRVGGDKIGGRAVILMDLFQSTPPVWGATRRLTASAVRCRFQSTPPVWGATGKANVLSHIYLFQSTPPVWGATL